MDKKVLEDMLLAIIDAPRPEKLAALKDALAKEGNISDDTAEQLEMLWEEWENRKISAPEAKFILEIAALGVPMCCPIEFGICEDGGQSSAAAVHRSGSGGESHRCARR